MKCSRAVVDVEENLPKSAVTENESTKRPWIRLCYKATQPDMSPPTQLVPWFKLPSPLTSLLIDLPASTFVSSKFLLQKVSKIILLKKFMWNILLFRSKLSDTPHFMHRKSWSLYRDCQAPLHLPSSAGEQRLQRREVENEAERWQPDGAGPHYSADTPATLPISSFPHTHMALFWLLQAFTQI